MPWTDSTPRIKAGIIGFGRMGEKYLKELLKSDQWEVTAICDTDPDSLHVARQLAPAATLLTQNENDLFGDPTLDTVILTALADSRKNQIIKAIASQKHIIAEKPIGQSRQDEWDAVRALEESSRMGTVNLALRNAWYNHILKDFIESGQIGNLAIIRVCHMTPGLMPNEGHQAEGPSFHDCGMHYVDITRWFAQSDFKSWNAQAIRMWSYPQPWWLQCHGTFENGIVFDVTQGHVYGQLAKDPTHNSYIDLIGTKGIARMSHDFVTATVDLHGVDVTRHIEKPYNDKNVDILCQKFATALRSGVPDPTLPTFRDSAIASQYAWTFLEDAERHDMPAVGTPAEMAAILDRRTNQHIGYGLLRQKRNK